MFLKEVAYYNDRMSEHWLLNYGMGRGIAKDHVRLISYFKLNEKGGHYLYNQALNYTYTPFIYSKTAFKWVNEIETFTLCKEYN